MKLSTWAKKQGIAYSTAFRWFKQGTFPAKAIQLETGTILVEDENIISRNENIVIYCRVSNNSRKDELEYQVDRCLEFCRAKGLEVNKIYKEIASGMNDKRNKLSLMLDSNPTKIIVEHKDRLTRFGFNYLEKLLSKLGCEIIVINRDFENENDLLKDMVSIITSFCCRLYGLRRGNNKAKKIQQVIDEEND